MKRAHSQDYIPRIYSNRRSRSPGGHGVTLIELVIVVAILVILAVLALPFLRADFPLRLRCQSNLRELGVLLAQYSQKHGQLPDFSYSRWCGAISHLPGGVYGWQELPTGQLAWFIDERDSGLFHCPAQPLPLLNTQGVRSSYAGLSINSFKALSDLPNASHRVLLFEFEHDPNQILRSVGTPTTHVYAYDSFEPGSGRVRVAMNHGTGGLILFSDQHIELVRGKKLDIGFWAPEYKGEDE